jgi:diguanylate cyclase (GGDEF)-like protein/PAS domain S-box-containing protein
MRLAAALVYWIIISLWLAVLWTICVAFIRNPKTFGTIRLLLSVLAIDTSRNIIENVYFGLYFGSQYGLFHSNIGEVLGHPFYLILPKVMNVVAACAVLVLLGLRWLPLASKEKASAEAVLRSKDDAHHQEAEERRRLFDTSLDLILVTDRKGVFVRVSPSSLSTLGYRPDEMIGHSGSKFILPDDLESTRQEMKLARSGRLTRNFETRYIHKNGQVVPLAWSGVWSDPEQKHFFFGRDMTDQKIAEERLRQLAHNDQLTGLPNRTSLQQDTVELFGHDQAAGRAVTIGILDLDGFKDINDTLGHSVGDKLLKAVAERLLTWSDQALVYRLGGDEFVLVIKDCGDPITATKTVDTILQDVAREFEVNDHRLFIAASAGIAIGPPHGASLDDLLSSADLALYDAKASGGRICRLFETPLRARAKHRRELDTELRRACANHEFVLYFQPQVRTNDGAIVGAEALLRWNHPQRGILAPGVFIDALAESAVAKEAGRWILTEACMVAASWRAKGLPPIRMGVNLFPAQFRNGNLLQDVEYALQKSGLPPEALELEITENIALGREEGTLAPLRELRARGIGIAFDDFGTGYASLSYLMRYPLTRIKIDRSFIQKIGSDCTVEDTAIVRSIIMMGRNLGLDVIAEGVETSMQAEFLKDQGCPELQGFLFSRPVSCEAFEKLVRASQREMESLAS